MRKILLLAAATTALAACSGGSSGTSPGPRDPIPPEAVAVRGNVYVAQHVPLADPAGSPFMPGHANYWDLDRDFSIQDGGGDQFDWGLMMSVGSLATKPPTHASLELEFPTLASFPRDQIYDELEFFGPLATDADGLVTAQVAAADPNASYADPLAGTYSAYLTPTPDSRLSRTVTLPSVDVGQALTLAWTDEVGTNDGFSSSYSAYWRVAIRATNGDLLAWALPEVGTHALDRHTFDVTSFAGQTVGISFEYRSNAWTYAIVDEVSVESSASPGTNLVENGDFEAGTLAGWTAGGSGAPTGVGSGVRTVGGLEVRRFFYTLPRNTWARWADELTNPGATAVEADVVYLTNLGSDGGGMIYDTPNAAGKAITTWDTLGSDRDAGLAFGSGAALYLPDTVMDAVWDGSDDVYIVHHLTVPPGGSAVLLHYAVMDGADTGRTAQSTSEKATEIDGVLAGIAAGVRSDPQYLDGLTAAQIAAISNW